jgi:hypothetical protein
MSCSDSGGGGAGCSQVGVRGLGGERKGERSEVRKEGRVVGGCGDSRIAVRRSGRSRLLVTYERAQLDQSPSRLGSLVERMDSISSR